MRKYINRKCYDTETAQLVGHWDNGEQVGSFSHVEEELYRKRGGEYFICGHGGAMTSYAEPCDGNMGSGSAIKPVSAEWARYWAEAHLDADEVEAEWGEPAEDDRESVNVWVCPEAKAALTAECRRTGDTQAKVVERLLLGLV